MPIFEVFDYMSNRGENTYIEFAAEEDDPETFHFAITCGRGKFEIYISESAARKLAEGFANWARHDSEAGDE